MSQHHTHLKPGFSLLELVFVIVILGIVASIGSQIIAQVYESYITQRALHRSSIKTELAATQLANRLAYSIPNTVIARESDSTFVSIAEIDDITTYEILEWIAYDADSFGAITATTSLGRRPIWSGYCDVNASTINALSTPGSRLSKLNGIISNLSTSSISDAAVFFPRTLNTAHTIGYAETGRSTLNVHPVSGNAGDETLNLDAKANRTIREHYKLAWTAYAVVATDVSSEAVARGFKAGDKLWDLSLHYDYQPWDGESYDDGQSTPLIRNISVFKFTGSGNTIRLKLCQRESIGGEYSTNTCKEKAVIR